jgi:hypothetical protein
VASIDRILASLYTVADRLAQALGAIVTTVELAEDVHQRLTALGAYGTADRMTELLDLLAEATARLSAAEGTAHEAIMLTLAARNGAGSGGVGDHSPGRWSAPTGQPAPRPGEGVDRRGIDRGAAGRHGNPADAGQRPRHQRLRGSGPDQRVANGGRPELGTDHPEDQRLDRPHRRHAEPGKIAGAGSSPPASPHPTAPTPARVHPNVPPYDGGKAQGILDIAGREQPLISGEDGPGRWLVDNLPGGPGSGLTRAWTHVEGHAAGVMHQHHITHANLYINKAPCRHRPGKMPLRAAQAAASRIRPGRTLPQRQRRNQHLAVRSRAQGLE